MTIASTVARNDYTGAGSVGPYAYNFKVFAASELDVIRRNTSTGAETQLAYLTDYTVTGAGNAAGGTVTLITALASGQTLTIRQNQPLTQTTDIRNQGSYLPETIEDRLDKITLQLQQIDEELGRAVKMARSNTVATSDVEIANATAGKVLTGTGSGFTLATLDSSATALPGSPRTVATLSAYLANNAVLNVMDVDTTIVANGVTDCTAKLTALWTALGATFTGVVYIPYNVKFTWNTVMATFPVRAILLDYSAVNAWYTAGYRQKFITIADGTSLDATDDTALRVSSGHNAGIVLDNRGNPTSSSGQYRIAGVQWGSGQFSKGPAGARLLSRIEWSKVPGDTKWWYILRRGAPWAAKDWEYWYTGFTYAAGSTVQNGPGFYSTASGGVAGATGPTHLSGTVSDGTVLWTYICDVDAGLWVVNENGEMATNGSPVAGVVAFLKANAFAGGNALVQIEGTGVSKSSGLAFRPTDGSGTPVAMPYFLSQTGVGTRLVDSATSKTLFQASDTNGLELGAYGHLEAVAPNLATTPSVANVAVLVFVNAGATSVTDLTGALPTAEVTLIFENANTTLVNSGTFKLKGGVNVTPVANTMIVMKKYSRSAAWIEKSRSF